MSNKTVFWLILLAILTPAVASAHCQIPCGIYDDKTRFTLLIRSES